ncbi:endospore germination permease [Caldicellulosiruptoraceae bacterium PP1]
MIIHDNDKISSFQVFILNLSVIIGVGILTMPAAITKFAKTDAWLSLTIGALLSVLLFLFLFKVSQLNPDVTLVEIMNNAFGKVISIILSFIYVIYFLILIAIEARVVADTTKEFIFELTPVEVLIIIYLFTCSYITRYGIEAVARICEILMPLVIIIIPLLTIFIYSKLDFTRLLPILTTKWTDIVKGSFTTIFSFIGYEIILFLSPYIRRKEKVVKYSLASFLIIFFIYELLLVFSIADFGVKELQIMSWPTMSLLRDVTALEVVIERPEIFIITFWLISAYTTTIIAIIINAIILARIFNTKEHNFFVFAQIPLVYIINLIPSNYNETLKYQDIYSRTLGIAVLFVIPLITFFTFLIKNKLKKRGAKN